MARTFLSAARLLIVMTLLTGIAYPLVVTGIAQAIFPDQANGSIVTRNGAPVGSRLVGQSFTSQAYFHGRPSAAGKDGYDATASSGSNLGPTSTALLQTAAANAVRVRLANGLPENVKVPADLVTASASGLDPHVSPEGAYLQVDRVAGERKLPVIAVRELVERHVEDRQMGIFGQRRINVLELNLALDRLQTTPSAE